MLVGNTIVKLCLIAFFGFYLTRRGKITDKEAEFLNFLVINFTIPFLIFSHLLENANLVRKHSLFLFLALSAGIFLAGYLLSYVFSLKMSSSLRKEFSSCVSLQNAGYLPMNIANFLFTASLKDEFLTYIFLYLLGFNIIIWSVGGFFLFHKKNEKFNFYSLFNPPVLAVIFSLAIIYTHTSSWVPKVLLSSLKMVGEISFVLSMLILGYWLAKIDKRGFYKNIFYTARAVFLKTLLLPAIVLIFIIKFHIFSLLGLFILLETAMPSAVSLPIVSNLHKADSRFVSQCVFLSHIISIFTVPLWIELFVALSKFNL